MKWHVFRKQSLFVFFFFFIFLMPKEERICAAVGCGPVDEGDEVVRGQL